MRRLIAFGVAVMVTLVAGQAIAGSLAAIGKDGIPRDGQTSIGYSPGTGEVWVDAPVGVDFTSINIDSAAGIFVNHEAAAPLLDGSFDNHAPNNIFKATFGSSFGSLSFGNVAQAGLAFDVVANDLTVVGSLAGGGDLGAVDLLWPPEPSTFVLAVLGLLGLTSLGPRLRHRVT